MRVGIGDDATVLPGGSVWSMDALVEGVHFDARLSPEDVGYKVVAVSVSDIAAMGARPTWLLLGVSVPGDDAFLGGFRAGVAEACRHYSVHLVGGDTTRSAGPRMFTSVVGGLLAGPPLLRSGGLPGHELWVSGPLGAAGAGWSRAEPLPSHLAALRRPPVSVERALDIAPFASAGMDLSDGLALDVERLARASGCGAVVDGAIVPLAEGVSLQEATRGGDDYVLLVAASPDHREELERQGWSRVGRLTHDPGVRLTPAGWPAPLFSHFEGTPG